MLDRLTRFFSIGQSASRAGSDAAVSAGDSSADGSELHADAETLKNRGNSHFAKGELDAAADCYRQAIAIAADYAEAHNNLGIVLQKQGRLEEALASFSRAIALKPALARAYLNRGNVQLAKGLLDEASSSFRTALSLDPTLPEAHNGLGSLLQARNDLEGALACFQAAVRLNPGSPEAHYNLSGLLHLRGDIDGALSSIRRATAIKPDFAEAYSSLGILAKASGDIEQARAYLETACSLKPDGWAALHNLGLLLYETARLDEAAVRFRQAIALKPDFADAYAGLGLVLRQLGDMDGALANLRRANALKSSDMNVLGNLALVLQDRDELDEAISCHEEALALKPEEGWRRFNLALPLLGSGRLHDGWGHYEHRFSAGVPKRSFPAAVWDGGDLAGKRLLVWGEQGIGDQIFWAGLFPEILARAGRCVIECAPKLVPLFATSFLDAEVVPTATEPHPATEVVDLQCPAGSLARWLRPSLTSFRPHRGYLKADPVRVAQWRRRLTDLGPGPKVGISWCGHIATGVRRLHYTGLDQWEPILARQGVHFISLQYDGRRDEIDAARRRFGVSLQAFEEVDLFDDLAESAALTKALDLVISAPTSTSFLAAALGVPTWMMSYARPWQMLGTDGFPWFPAMRCFPRRWDEEWDAVIRRIARSLDSYHTEIHA